MICECNYSALFDKTTIFFSSLGLEMKNDPGLMNGLALTDTKTSTFVLDFLEPGKQYVATLYEDGKDAGYERNPTFYQIKRGIVTAGNRISAKLARSGGFALSLIGTTPGDKRIIKKWK